MGLVLRSWAANEAAKHCAVVVWVAVSAWLFWRTFRLFSSGPQYYYLHQMLGLGLCISRASASVLNLNCSLVLLPMCRSILTVLRGTQQVNSRKARRLLDKSKTFHVVCGVSICVFSVVHVCAHLVNAVSFSVRYSDDFPALNVAQHRGQDPRILILTTVPGITGVILVLILFLMFTASSYSIRVCNYEIFWYTHNLFILFYIILMLHVVGGALKYQTNVDTHPPGCIRTNQTNSSSYTSSNQVPETQTKAELKEMPHITVCKEDAHFQHHFPQTWLWVTAPLCLYCAERLYRYIRGSAPVTVVSVIRHPCDVIELRMLKSGFKARPGQYILLNCPSVSSFENHAFTLTACPTQNKETFGIHIRVLGDWTECLSELLFPALNHSEILPIMHQRTYPKLYVDGPFGTPSEEVFNYEVSVCVAGGIGVTPFACVLHTLLGGWSQYRLRRLYVVWVCRELQCFYWFANLLCDLHHKLWEENRPDYLNIRLYLTNTQQLQSFSEERFRPLSSRLLIGRPRWKDIFGEIGQSNQHKKVGVFCCGPKSVSRELHKLCNSFSASGTVFEYNKESFS
ncbi:NADPH oxidase 4 [Astyanax mexicanus]|uniref:NADPH oxidase 4 n=1 Tax=Astyanax mexicanus TaxID=7994 RepID=UPI0020CB5040|nr:NADPH oxidase 4 [Astyanax mexicanus]